MGVSGSVRVCVRMGVWVCACARVRVAPLLVARLLTAPLLIAPLLLSLVPLGSLFLQQTWQEYGRAPEREWVGETDQQ